MLHSRRKKIIYRFFRHCVFVFDKKNEKNYTCVHKKEKWSYQNIILRHQPVLTSSEVHTNFQSTKCPIQTTFGTERQ